MRRPLLALAALLLTAASPASEEASRLMEAERQQEAFDLVQREAETGDADAIDYLAWFYDEGQVVPRDHARAAALYRRAAEAGNRHAQWRLGVMLDLGEGVAPNPDEALVWLRRAAAQGSPRAHTSLGVMHATGRGTPVDYAAALRYYSEGAPMGDPHGFYGVGILYGRGEGVEQDLVEAMGWILASAALGDEEAQGIADQVRLPPPDDGAAVARANEILRTHGHEGVEVRLGPSEPMRESPAPVA